MMTDHERRLVLRGMSIARGLLVNTPCTHHGLIKEYQKLLADAWNIDDGSPEHRLEFKQLVAEMNEAIAANHPDAINLSRANGKPPLKH
jgi:hypothetical protein